ncbi:MAG: hypothetical protein KDD33_05550 [Bdellovibrionales bacterium]|nr:hypothetical protein [Bdellovibrionales bacterium]
MNKVIASLIVICAFGLIAYSSPQVQFFTKPKHQRLYKLWKADMDNLAKKDEFKKLFLNIGKIEFEFPDPQVAEELGDLGSPFVKRDGANYVLKIEIIRWIHGNRYGYVIQHNIFDLSDDKLFEFGRTYKVGWIW